MTKTKTDPRKKKLKLKLKCTLTDEERIAIGNTMAETLNEIGSLENDAKSMASDFKAKIESREKTLIRLDSGNVVEITKMTDEEKQQSLPLDEQE